MSNEQGNGMQSGQPQDDWEPVEGSLQDGLQQSNRGPEQAADEHTQVIGQAPDDAGADVTQDLGLPAESHFGEEPTQAFAPQNQGPDYQDSSQQGFQDPGQYPTQDFSQGFGMQDQTQGYPTQDFSQAYGVQDQTQGYGSQAYGMQDQTQGYGSQGYQQPYGQQDGQQQPGQPPAGPGGGGSDMYGQPDKPSRKGLWITLGVLVAALAAGLILWLVFRDGGDPEPAPSPTAAEPSEQPSEPEQPTDQPQEPTEPETTDEPVETAEPQPTDEPAQPTESTPEESTPQETAPEPSATAEPPAETGGRQSFPAEVAGLQAENAGRTNGSYRDGQRLVFLVSSFQSLTMEKLTEDLTDVQTINGWTCGTNDLSNSVCLQEQPEGRVRVTGTQATLEETAAFGDQFLAAWK